MTPFPHDLYTYSTIIYSFCITIDIILLPLTIYALKFHSKGLQTYRYYLACNLFFGYSVNICAFIFRPVILFPTLCAVFKPINVHFNKLVVPFLPVDCLVVTCLCYSPIFCMFYCFAQPFHGYLHDLFTQSKIIVCIYFGIILFSASFLSSFLKYCLLNEEESINFLKNSNYNLDFTNVYIDNGKTNNSYKEITSKNF